MIFKTSKIGIIMMKFFLRVLCLNTFIPNMEPSEPPRVESKNKEDSGILKRCFLALFLSIKNRRKLVIFISIK